ncbi:MAG TPA: type II toxin-antitoxin system RelE/ParE family toxin [Candidatus Dormibacteraeota bacterium]|nr:type II toxin-antitoxin system RelE/ParE family toxin [Candidatus Dormibacteraeota bacterium]
MLSIFRTDAFIDDVDSQIRWYLYETDLEQTPAIELAQRFATAVEATLEFLARFPMAGRPRSVRFADLVGYRGLNVLEPFGRFRIYYRIIGQELHAERLLEGHRLAASDGR